MYCRCQDIFYKSNPRRKRKKKKLFLSNIKTIRSCKYTVFNYSENMIINNPNFADKYLTHSLVNCLSPMEVKAS